MQLLNTYPLALASVAAGFPGTAETENYTQNLSFDDLLVKHQPSTFFVRVSGNSLIEAGIFEQDILVVDRQLKPRTGDLVIAIIQNEFTAKFLSRDSSNQPILLPANKNYRPISFKPGSDLTIWGVATGVVRQLKSTANSRLIT